MVIAVIWDSGDDELGIIADAKALSVNVLTEQITGRKRQIETLRKVLTAANGKLSCNVWVYGPTGSGKTLTVRRTVNDICSAESKEVIYIDSWQHRSIYSVLGAIVCQLKILRADAQDTNVKFDRIRQRLRGKSAIIILDRIDRLMPHQANEIIYTLMNIPRVTLVCIANDIGAIAKLDSQIQSLLSPMMIEFPAYSHTRLVSILTERARKGLAFGSWSSSQIEYIARHASGDARAAINWLRQSAVLAEQAHLRKLDTKIIKSLLNHWRIIKTQSQLTSLSQHEKILYTLAKKYAPIGVTHLYRRYISYCISYNLQPMARRTISKYINRLISAGVLHISAHSATGGGRIISLSQHQKLL